MSRRQPRGIALLAFALVCSLVTFAPLPAVAQEEPQQFEPGGVFVTGHDPDFHAYLGPNATGARRLIQAAVGYVTGNNPDPSILLITSDQSAGGGHSDPQLGMQAAGYQSFEVAAFGSQDPTVHDVTTVDFTQYDAVVVASDFGGWLRQAELDALTDRSDELIDYVNNGGGLVGFAESGAGNGITNGGWYDYLPFLVSEVPLSRFEQGNTVTQLGLDMGLVDSDINGNFSHNIFTESGGMEPVGLDPNGNVLTLATKKQVGDGGVIDDPPPPLFIPPEADAGPDQSVPEGSVVELDASNSTASGLTVDTFTTTEDFELGSLVNLDPSDDRLSLDETQKAFAFIWIAASARGTVVKIDTRTGEVLGEYWSAPQNRSKNPSRTTVDQDGNVWVGNRNESSTVAGVSKGSVVKIGLAENGQCIDRNGNGAIDTSSGLGDIRPWPNSGGEDTTGGVTTAEDECVIEYVRTNGRNIRHVSVDTENHVWVGGDGFGGTPRYMDRLTPDGEIVRSINMASNAETGAGSVPCCYGGLVDPNGVIWSASNGSNQLVRIDPSKPNGHPNLIRRIPLGRNSYGLGIDPDGFIWQSNWTRNTIQKISPSGTILGTFPTGGPSRDRGVVVTADGDVWVANSGGASVSRLSNSGTFKTQIQVGVQPTGVAVDADGKVWAANLSSNSASRIDPATNSVDLTVDLGSGAGPYNYSDMTGSTLSGAPERGTWATVVDSEVAGTEWALLDWNADTPGDGSLTVTVATSSDGVMFGAETPVEPGMPLGGVTGQYLRVTVTFDRSGGGDSPTLFDISVARPGGDATLTFDWQIIDSDGPPIYLSSTTSPTPTFVAPDDGSYTFEVTVTDSAGLTDSDRVVVTVDNEDPVLTVEPGSAFAGGVTLIHGSFTDPGWLDTHTATVDWGDGTIDTFAVTTQGSGWGTFFGSHVYEEAGSYDVVVALSDDDGGEDVESLSGFEVQSPVAVWADSETAPQTLDWGGGQGLIDGRVHSNNALSIRGQSKTTTGPLEYVSDGVIIEGEHLLDPPPVQVAASEPPLAHDLADYRPGGPVATAVGGDYHDMSSECGGNGRWSLENVVLDPGVYYVDCGVEFDGSNVGGEVTIAAEGVIWVDGSRPAFEPFYDGVLFLSGSSDHRAVEINTDASKFLGVIWAIDGKVTLAGSDNRFFCGVYGDVVSINGSDLTLRGSNCGRPDSTVSGPLLVPDLTLSLEGSPDDVLPSEDIAYDLTIGNDGSQLFVPALMGLENVDTASATVTGFDFTIEYFDIATSAWVPLSSAGDVNMVLSTSANPTPNVTFNGDDPVGTVIDPDGLATWGFQAAVSLTPSETELLLDPSQVGGLRNRSEFTADPNSVQLRRLFTLGTDFIEEVRSLSGDITDIDVVFIEPDSEQVVFDQATLDALAALVPGETVTVSEAFTVPVPAARSDSESDTGYLARLLNLDGSALTSFAFALASGGVGRLVGPVSVTTSTEHLPVVNIETVGIDQIPAGAAVDYDLPTANVGSADATGIAVAATAGSDSLTVTDPPASLMAGENHTAATSYTAPTDTEGGRIDIRSEVTWSDAAGNSYGPDGSTLEATLLAPATLQATLVDELVVDDNGDGFVSPGDTIRYIVTVTNSGGVDLTGVVATVTPDPNSDLVAGSTQTSDGTVLATTPEVIFDFGTIVGGGGSASGIFDVVVADPFPDGIIRVEAQGTVEANGFDPVSTDDPSRPGAADATSTTVIVPTPRLLAALSGVHSIDRDGDGAASAGDGLRYTLDVVSVGSLPVTGVEVSVPIPSGGTLVAGSVETTVGSVNAGSDVSVTVGELGPLGNEDDAATITFDVDISDPLPDGVDSIALQGVVTSNELPPLDTDDPNTFTSRDATVIEVGDPGSALPGPTLSDVSPADGTILTEPTPISATLIAPSGETVESWTLSIRRADDNNVTQLAAGSGSTIAGDIDPTLLPNGTYMLVISAESSTGGISVTETSVVVDGRLKPGRYQTTFQDLNVGVGGFPIQVLRTYDSFDKATGDFGVGWSLDVADFRVSANGPLGAGGWTEESCGGGPIFVTLCYSSTNPHFVTVTWPDGLTEIFDLTPADGSTFFPHLTSAEFTGRPTTTSTLEATSTGLFWSNGDLLGGTFGSGGVYDPVEFRLTDRFGTEYLLEVGVGLKEMRDRNGNTLTITDDGITSSFGPSVEFTRDSQGRITGVTDPDGGVITYEYDANGDLVSVTDQEGNETTLTYLPDHFLDEIIDPLGRPFTTFEYDAEGRIAAVIDGEGNRVEVTSEVGARTETVTDAEQRLTTISTFDERGNLITLDEVFDGGSHVTAFTYDDFDNLVSRTDPDGNTWSATYDGRDLTSFDDPSGDDLAISYDDVGFPLVWTDQNGETTTYDWNPDGTLASITDANGNVESYTYDGSGNRLTRTDRESNTRTWTYTSGGLVETETDPEGNTTAFGYDGSGRVTSTIDAAGNTTTRSYDGLGNLRFETDRDGNTTEWRYDSLNRLTERVDPEGFSTVWTYDDAGRVTSVGNDVDAPTAYEYDGNGRVTSIQIGSLTPTVFSYDGGGRLAFETDPVGRTTSYEYFSNGWLESEINPAGGATSYTYHPDGQVATVTDPEGGVTATTYDASGRVASTTDPEGRVTSYAHDPVGRLETTTFNDGTTTENVYDDAGRLVATIDQEGEQTSFEYDGAGNRTAVVDPEGRRAESVFDELNRLERTIAADGGETVSTHTPEGRLSSITTPEGVATEFGYDGRGLQTSRTDGLDNTWSTTYDAAGRPVTETDPRGAVTTNDYDPFGRLASITDNAGNQMLFGLDDAGQQTSLTDPRGETWSFTYHPLGGVVAETDPLGNTQTWDYDLTGRVVSHTDGRSVTVDTDYLADGRVDTISEQGGTGSITYTYDDAGRRKTMTDDTGTTTWTYYPDGQVESASSPAGTVSYLYDGSNRRTSLVQPEGATNYGYDPAGRLSSASDWNVDTTLFSYDRDGRIETITRPNEVESDWTYDAAGRVDRIEHQGPADVIDFYDYGYDDAGNRTSMTSATGVESYTINLLNQLTDVSYPDGTDVSYTYDAAGNRLTETTGGSTVEYSHDAASRLTSVDGTPYTYDASGNLTSDSANTYGYDWQGRLVSVDDGTITTTYGYDGDHIRVTVDTQDHLYDRSGWTGLPELITTGTTAYTHSPEGPISQIATTSHSLLGDGLGSIRSITDPAAAVVGSNSYDVFGDITSQTGTTTPFGYIGAQQTDDLVYLNARYLSPDIGRFLSVDTVRPGAPGVTGYNPYTYVANNPATWVDPTGLFHQTKTRVGGGTSTGYASLLSIALTASVAVAEVGLVIAVLFAPAVCLIDGVCPTPHPPRSDDDSDLGDLVSQIADLYPEATQEQATDLARTCEELVRHASVPDDASCSKKHVLFHTERSPGLVPIDQATSHIATAIKSTSQWAYLTKGPNAYVLEKGSVEAARGWYDLARFRDEFKTWDQDVCAPRRQRLPNHCDEYPPLATLQGGPLSRPKVSLLGILGVHNTTSGATFQSGYQTCPVADNEGFLVIPVQTEPILPIPGGPGLANLPSRWKCGR